MTQPSGRSPGRIALGAALIVGGVLWVLDATGVLDVPPRAILPSVLIGIGVLLVADAHYGASPGLLVAGGVLTAVLALGSVVAPSGGSFEAFGDRREQPTSVREITDYGAAFGQLTVDLTEVPFPEGTVDVEAGVAFGSLVVLVPDGVRVEGTVDVAFGSARIFGREYDGFTSDTRFSDGRSGRVVDLALSVVFGDIALRRIDVSPDITVPAPDA